MPAQEEAALGINPALKFVLLIGVVSFFADFTYEGSRSITGPYLAILGANATAVGVIAGIGELLGYGLRVVSGPLSERTRQFWPVTLFGYFVQMLSVPALAMARTWPAAALLIVLERIGKAIRNPPRDVMLSHAAKQMGYGWVISWLAEVDDDRVFISVISFAEIRRGIEMLPAGRRRERLATCASALIGRILDINNERTLLAQALIMCREFSPSSVAQASSLWF